MKKLLMTLCLTAAMVIMAGGTVLAAEMNMEESTESTITIDDIDVTDGVTFEELNADDTFITQSSRGKCTLASSAMIMRRAAMLSGNEDWESITESSVGSVAWRSGVGISWVFSYGGVTLQHDYVSSVEDIKALLAAHPEGIVAYDSYMPHAIALTDYDEETDTFYCCDPSEVRPESRIPVSESLISINNVDVVWYVTAPTELSITVPEEEPETETLEEIVAVLKMDTMSVSGLNKSDAVFEALAR